VTIILLGELYFKDETMRSGVGGAVPCRLGLCFPFFTKVACAFCNIFHAMRLGFPVCDDPAGARSRSGLCPQSGHQMRNGFLENQQFPLV